MAGDARNNKLDETSMKKKSISQSAFFSLRILISLVAILSGVCLALFATSAQVKRPERAVNLKSPLGGVQEEWIALYNGGNGFDVAYVTQDGDGAMLGLAGVRGGIARQRDRPGRDAVAM